MSIHPRRHSVGRHGIGIATKAVLVFVLGFVIIVACRSTIAPAEAVAESATAPVTEATSFIAPFEATAMSADGRDGDTTLPMSAAQGAVVEQGAVAPSPSPHLEPSSVAVRDDAGHSPAF